MRSLLTSLVLSIGLLLTVSAATALAAPTVSVSKACYREDRTIDLTGSGFTPGGVVNATIAFAGQQTTWPLMADAAGNITVNLRAPLVEGRPDAVLTAVDTARVAQGAPASETSASVGFKITDWSILIPGFAGRSWRPGAKTLVSAIGWAHAIGQTLYAHYVRAGRLQFSQAVGVLAPPCGDLYASMVTYRRPRPAFYRVYMDASPKWPNAIEGKIFDVRPRF
jgi:hypothetical protein